MLHNVFIWFLDQENIGLDPKIMILHEIISEILEISDFEAAILKYGRNQFFLVTSLMGCMGTPVSSRTIYYDNQLWVV